MNIDSVTFYRVCRIACLLLVALPEVGSTSETKAEREFSVPAVDQIDPAQGCSRTFAEDFLGRQVSTGDPARFGEFEPGERQLTQSCYVTADALARDGRENVIYVDVRSPKRYAQGRIPGSINLSPHTIRARSYLREYSLILVDEPYAYTAIDALCISLRENGFNKIQVLRGGIGAWAEHAGAIDGPGPGSFRTDHISARHFEMERQLEHWRVLDFSTSELNGTQSAIDATRHHRLVQLVQAAGPPAVDQLTLVVSDTPQDYASLRLITRQAGWTDVFFLDGGKAAYRRVRATSHAMTTYKPGRASAPRSCRSPG